MGLPIAGHLARAGVPVVVADLDGLRCARASRGHERRGRSGRPGRPVRRRPRSSFPATTTCGPCARGTPACWRAPGRAPVVLLCSSVRPDTCEAVTAAAPAGVAVLDAALTGGVRGAENGQINLLVGGDPAALDRVRPALAAWTVLGAPPRPAGCRPGRQDGQQPHPLGADRRDRRVAGAGPALRPRRPDPAAGAAGRARRRAGRWPSSSRCGSPGTRRTSRTPR